MVSVLQHEDGGAQFLNADLHVHSFGGSADVVDAGMTPQAIVDAAVQQGLHVVAITDHNSDRNVAAALAHAQQYTGRLLVLAGVEVTTGHGHLLAYFAPERSADLTTFLARLDIRRQRDRSETSVVRHHERGIYARERKRASR